MKFLAFLLLSLCAHATKPQSLFDGKTLDQWQGTPGFWSVEDGAITASIEDGKTLSKNESRAVPPPTQAFKSALRKTPRDTLPGINAISTTASSGSAESTTNMAAVSSPSAVLSPRFPELGRITPSPSPNLPHSRALPRLRTGIITSFAAAAIVSRSTSMAPTSRPSRTTRKTKLISADSSQSKFTAEPAPPKFNSAISP